MENQIAAQKRLAMTENGEALGRILRLRETQTRAGFTSSSGRAYAGLIAPVCSPCAGIDL
jgi:hypothetical protein